MTKTKPKLNWYFIIAGVLLLYLNFSNGYTVKQDELRKITVELSNDVTKNKGRRIDLKIWTKEYKNQFNILNGSITGPNRDAILNLKRGQKVDLLVSVTDYDKLGKKNKDIIIRAISINEVYLMSPDEFLNNQNLYRKRLMIIGSFIGLMLLVNGFTAIPGKVNYAIVGTFVGTLIIMKIFDFGLF